MSIEQATFGAAVVAAVAAVVTAFMALTGQWRAEARAAVRDLLRDLLPPFGEALHTLIACTKIALLRTAAGQSPVDWQERAVAAAESLKGLRPKVKYPLLGMIEPIGVLTRLPDWASHVQQDNARSAHLLEMAEGLRERLDEVAWRAFLRGRTPTLWERRRCAAWAERVREAFSGEPNAE